MGGVCISRDRFWDDADSPSTRLASSLASSCRSCVPMDDPGPMESPTESPEKSMAPESGGHDEIPASDASRLVKEVVLDVKLEGLTKWLSESDGMRMLTATEGDFELAKEKLKQACHWRESTLKGWINTCTESEMRVIAVGHEGRPVLFHCAAFQKSGDNLPAHWAVMWDLALRRAGDEPGKRPRQMDIVVDCHGFQLMINLYFSPYLKLAPAMDSYFAERIHRFYLVDFPLAAKFLWIAGQPFVPPKTKKKIIFVNRNTPGQLEELIQDVGKDEGMRGMLQNLFAMCKSSRAGDDREPTHRFTNEFLKRSSIPAES